MGTILFEFAIQTPSQGSVPGTSSAHGMRHTIEIEHPLTPARLMRAELQFLYWFQDNHPGSELLSWAAKDPATERIFSQYRSDLHAILERIDILRRMARRQDPDDTDTRGRFTVVGS